MQYSDVGEVYVCFRKNFIGQNMCVMWDVSREENSGYVYCVLL